MTIYNSKKNACNVTFINVISKVFISKVIISKAFIRIVVVSARGRRRFMGGIDKASFVNLMNILNGREP